MTKRGLGCAQYAKKTTVNPRTDTDTMECVEHNMVLVAIDGRGLTKFMAVSDVPDPSTVMNTDFLDTATATTRYKNTITAWGNTQSI